MLIDRKLTIFLLSILGITMLMIFALYTDALTPSGVTGLATVLLVLVTIVYTINTREQAHATRASYAPSLDIKVYPKTDHLAFDITNRGEGVARNIVLQVRIGDHEYHGYITDSLSPGEQLYSPYGPDNNRVAVVPRYYEPRIERRDREQTPPRRALKQGQKSPMKTMTDILGSAQLTLPELLEMKQQIGGGWTMPNGDLYVPLEIKITYTDVTEKSDFVTESPAFNNTIVKAQSGNIHQIFTRNNGVTTSEGRWHKFKRKYFNGRDIAPYAETLNTGVQRRITPLPKTE